VEYTQMEQYWIWLSSVQGVGIKRFNRLLADFGDARTLWDNIRGTPVPYLPQKVYQAILGARTDEYFYALFRRFEEREIACIPLISELYPQSLARIEDAPNVLYVKGEGNLLFDRAISVVGTRNATRDGLRAAYDICKELAQHGVTIVSGMARGIDTQAHLGCLDGCGRTVAVLGSGADVVYPPENKKLYERILQCGGMIVSEQMPGTGPLAQNFPARNRIISALSEGVLLVEAGKRSGGLITTEFAAEQGKELFVVPGSIYSESCAGSNALLRDCNSPVCDAWDILEYYRWAQRETNGESRAPHIALTDEEKRILALLRREELSFDELIDETGFAAPELNSLLTTMELTGKIARAPGKVYRARV
jgi:DNA processing protein